MKLHKVIGTFIFAAALPFSVQAESISSGEMVDVQVVDYSGKPPFKRRTVSLSVNDVAQLESVGEEAIDYVKVTEVIKHGKPPYRRVTKMMPVYDVAQFEVLEEEDNNMPKSGTRPPFKRHN